MEDQQPGSGDLTGDAPAARPRRRLFGRRPKSAAAEPVADAVEAETEQAAAADAVEDAPKRPMGKGARAKGAVSENAETAPDLEAETPAAEADPAPADSEASEDESTPEVSEPEATEPQAEAEVEADPEPEPVVMVPHRPAGRGVLIATAVASVVFVGASGFAAAMAQPYLSERALVQTKLTIARTATDAITTLWSYTPEDMSSLAERASAYLTGDFAAEYRRYIDAIVEANKQAQVTNTTQVMGAAVESVSPPSIPTEATALVYTNSVATSPVTKNIPSLRYLSYRLTMNRDGGEWRITRMSTITSFDLTPQL
ncbi:mammalian cell entry protein [Mycolicibacterium gilvum]|uniref:MCE associated membrane protein n=1 Tax=Mycolicibacterium gilvum TaxID=1804 RepID=A0A378SEA7_9MYCO|nr:mammalian cell entry protein [Mycolicibacterium gilvum]MCV7053662.1 mammalian cell entry protein [Mycolicibacterium gilvum]STZ40941.1 MCE associated membrane protein [Mycolicibacterium gilvum]